MVKEKVMLNKITRELDVVRIQFAGNGYVAEVEGRDEDRDYVTERVVCLNHDDVLNVLKECDAIYAKG